MTTTTTVSPPVFSIFVLLQGFASGSVPAMGLVPTICDALFADMDLLCQYAKQAEVIGLYGITSEAHRAGDSDFSGRYVSLGLGRHSLNLGFLEEAVVAEIRRRLEEKTKTHYRFEPCTVATLAGSVTLSGKLYLTSDGVYELWHSFAWFFRKRVDP